MNTQAVLTRQEVKSFETPEDVRTFGAGKLEIVNIGGSVIGRVRLEPGWRWSRDVKPIAKTELCEAPHVQYVISGKLRIRMEDGTEFDIEKGTVASIPPGHEAWVVGDEPFIAVDWSGMSKYATLNK